MQKTDRRWKGENLQEYVISACLHSKEALAKAMSNLIGVRDFTNEKLRDAFAIIEMRYEKGKELDPVVIVDEWIDMGIMQPGEAKAVAGAYEGDTYYDPKIQELAKLGGHRKAKKDIEGLHELSKNDVEISELAKKAMDKATSWISGTQKKYYSGREIDQQVENEDIGRKLQQGIPLLDDKLYRNAGQHTGTIKATVFREKHGKTRHACWECAQDLRQGHKVLYVTMEGTRKDINGNIKQVLRHEWKDVRDNFFVKDGTVDSSEIQAAITEAVFADDIDKVVIDYLHLMEQPNRKYLSENENSNRCCQQITQLCVRHDIHGHILNQSRQSEKHTRGYDNVPKVYDCYGSNQLIKDASIILVGIRPKNMEELLTETKVPPFKPRVKDPDGNEAPINSVFIKPILSRKKLECQHQWMHLIDSDEGLKLHRNELI